MQNELIKSKLLKIIKGIALGVAGLAAFILVVGGFFSLDENHHKRLINNELNRISTPNHCSEVTRSYTHSDLDAQSTWTANYKCDGITNAQLYDEITSKMQNLNYKIVRDYSTEGPNVFYSFTWQSPKFNVDYSFDDKQINSVPIAQKEQLATQPATYFQLNIVEM